MLFQGDPATHWFPGRPAVPDVAAFGAWLSEGSDFDVGLILCLWVVCRAERQVRCKP